MEIGVHGMFFQYDSVPGAVQLGVPVTLYDTMVLELWALAMFKNPLKPIIATVTTKMVNNA